MRSYAVIPDSNQVSGFETEHVQISQRSVGSWNFQSSGKLQQFVSSFHQEPGSKIVISVIIPEVKYCKCNSEDDKNCHTVIFDIPNETELNEIQMN